MYAQCNHRVPTPSSFLLHAPKWTPPLNDSAELSQGALYLVNSLLWDCNQIPTIPVYSLESYSYSLITVLAFLQISQCFIFLQCVLGTPTKRQVSKHHASKRLVSKRPVSKRQVYKTSGLQNVRFQNVWFQNVWFQTVHRDKSLNTSSF